MQNNQNDFLKIGWVLSKLGIEPTPRIVQLIKIILIAVGVIAIFVINTEDKAAKYGNYDELQEMYPDEI